MGQLRVKKYNLYFFLICYSSVPYLVTSFWHVSVFFCLKKKSYSTDFLLVNTLSVCLMRKSLFYLHFRIILLSFILMSLQLFYFKYFPFSLLLIFQLTINYAFKNFSQKWDYVSIFLFLWLSVWKVSINSYLNSLGLSAHLLSLLMSQRCSLCYSVFYL